MKSFGFILIGGVMFLNGCATMFPYQGFKRSQGEYNMVKTADGVKIAYHHLKQGHSRVVIIAHGFYNSKEALLLRDLGEALLSQYDVVIMDFRGHGKSEGLFTWTSKEYLDLLAVVGAVKDQYQSVGVIGFSLGAATTVIGASKTTDITSIILVSPPTDFNKIEYRLWQLDPAIDLSYSLFGEGRIGKGVRPGPWWLLKEKPIDCIAKLKQPIYIIHGTKDWIIKPWHATALYQAAQSSIKKLDIIDQGPHAEYLMLTHREQLCASIEDWFKQTLP